MAADGVAAEPVARKPLATLAEPFRGFARAAGGFQRLEPVNPARRDLKFVRQHAMTTASDFDEDERAQPMMGLGPRLERGG